jgi:hypothetical protein
MQGLWIGIDIEGRPDITELEHRVLTSLDLLPSRPDHVVTHVARKGVPYATAALHFRADDTSRSSTADLARRLVDLLGGTAVGVLDAVRPTGGDHAAVVAGDPASAVHCLKQARDSFHRIAGRCVRFPGQARLTGSHPVNRILERSAITRVASSGWPVALDDMVRTDGFLRPVFEHGELVLRVDPAAGGRFVPSETFEPSTCCGGHPLQARSPVEGPAVVPIGAALFASA